MTYPKLNYHNKIIIVSSAILAISALLLSGIIGWLLYTAVFDDEAKRLVEIAHNQAQLMEAVARFDAQYSAQDVEGGAVAATLSQIAEAHKHYQGFGKTGEVALAWREGDKMVFILSQRNFDMDNPLIVPWNSPLAEPMRRALKGETGTVIGLDYRSQSVLAAYQPISPLNLGIVAKIDIAEIRAPFIDTGEIAIGMTLLIILIGFFAFQRLVNPIIVRMEESEERFRTLFEGAPDALFLIDPKTHQVLDANPTASQLLLKSHQEIIGSHQSQLYSSSAKKRENGEKTFNNKANVCAHIETVVRRSDGKTVPVEVLSHTIKIHGQPIIQSILRDITERKQAEEQLRLSEQWFRKLFEEGPIGMFTADLDTRFIKVNTAFCQMLGYSESELVGTSIADITYAEDISKSIESIKQQMGGECSSYQLEKRYITKNGQLVWGHLTVSFFQDEHGTPLYLLGKIENITARKQTEVALQKSELRYRSIVNTLSEIGEGLIIIDENFSVQYMNQVMIDWFGEQTHKICYASIAGLEQPCSYCQLEQIIANGNTVHYQPTMPDGRTFEIVATPLPNANGTFSKIEVLRDITAQKQAYEALIQSQQRYKTLVHSIDGVVWEADAKTFQFTFISQQAERVFGYPLDDWLNQPSFWAEHIHPDDRAWATTYCAESTANKRDHDFEYRMITADLRTLWIRDLVTVIVENDQAVKLCGIMLDVTVQKAAEEKIAIFQRFMETSGEGMGMATMDGKVVYMNPSLCRFIDQPNLKTVLGRQFTSLYPETQQLRFQAEVMPKLLQTGQWAGEMKIISSNGKITQTYESFFLIKDNEEQPLYLAAVISNITDIKRTQEALKKANLALTALIECRQVLFHAQDEQTMLQEICQVLVQKVGYRLVWIGFAEADANQTVRPVAQYGYEDGYLDNLSVSWGDNELGQGPTSIAIRTGKPSIAHQIQTDPKYAPWRYQARQRGYASSMAMPLMLQQKAIGAINIYASQPNAFDTDIIKLFEELAADISYGLKMLRTRFARQQAEQQLRQSEERFRKMFEDGPIGMVIIDSDNRLLKVNTAFCQMLGYTEAELLEMKVADVSHPEDMSRNLELRQQMLNGDIPFIQMEKRYLRKDGQIVWGNLAVSFYKTEEIVYHLAKVEDITERKLAEEQIRKLSTAIEQSPSIVVITDTQARIEYVNPKFCQITGFTSAEVIGQTPTLLKSGQQPKDFYQNLWQTVLSGNDWQSELQNKKKNGTLYWELASISPLKNQGQAITHFIKVAEDITERKQAEDKLRASEKRFRKVFEEAPLGMVIVGYYLKILQVNKAFYQMLGYSGPEPLIGATITDISAPEDIPKTKEMMMQLYHGEISSFKMEKRYRQQDGTLVWGNTSVSFFYDKKGQPLYFLAMIENITERKQAEQSLRESETRIRTLVENMVDGVVTIDENGMIESFNPAAMKIFGYSAEDVIGKNVKILMPEPYRHEHDGYLEHYKSTGIAKIIGKGREVEGQHQNGFTFPLDLAVSEMWIGEQRKFVGIVRNITKRKQFEETLKKAIESAQAANRAKSEFLANMSHEIRTPMNAVIGFSELLSTLITDNQQKSYLDSIQTAGKSLLTLINDILDLSKIEAGRLDIQYEVVNPLLIFNELQQIFAIKMVEKNLQWIVDIDKQLPPALLLDEVRLRQVLLNLIGNAIKFTDKGYIKLTAKMSPSRTFSNKATAQNIMDGTAKPIQSDLLTEKVGDLILTVEDTGIGIPENQQAVIFESFRQQEGQSTRKYGGTGLGLAITKRLVEMMNGQISVKSTASQGSVFEITLREVQVSSIESVKTDEESFDFKNIYFENAQVLVVDDIESNRTLIKEYLSKVNLEVVEAEDGQKGLLFAQEYKPDLIIMDIRMPEMDGYEATRRLKENPSTQKIPVIALTASVTVDEKTNVKAHGFDGYLSKPVSTQLLFNELTHYLKHSKKLTKPQAAKVDDDTKLLLETWIKLPVLLQTLEEKMLPVWQEIIDMIETDAVEEFAEQLIDLGKKHHASILINYATKLRDKAQEFDIDGVELTLEEFSAILDRIKTAK